MDLIGKGQNDLIDNISDAIVDNLKHELTGEPFVIGIHGEWGAGKTRCLKQIEKYFRLEDKQELLNDLQEHEFQTRRHNDQNILYIPIFFQPWKYDDEVHLITPLFDILKHEVQMTREILNHKYRYRKLKKFRTYNKSLDLLNNHLESIARLIPAMISGGIELPNALDLAFAASSILKNARSILNMDEKEIESEQKELLTKEFYKTTQALKKLHDHKGYIRFQFIVLIDDLDRCLPEKTVEMLETIKLFLQLENFSFVLAMDDSIVEKAIEQRYERYNEHNETDKTSEHSPHINSQQSLISGAEYLEKIVHLPIHLPRWSPEYAKRFLDQSFKDIYGVYKYAYEDIDNYNQLGEQRYEQKIEINHDLINLVVGSMPANPRKLIRASESIRFKRRHIEKISRYLHVKDDHIDLETIARLVILQQIFPELYRFIREHNYVYNWLFQTKEIPADGKENSNIQYHLTGFENSTDPIFHKYINILKKIRDTNKYYNSPFFAFGGKNISAQGFKDIKDWKKFRSLYLLGDVDALLVSDELVKESNKISRFSYDIHEKEFKESVISAKDSAMRQNFIIDHQLDKGDLPDHLFNHLISHFDKSNTDRDSLYNDINQQWVYDIASIMSVSQLTTFLKKSQLFHFLFMRYQELLANNNNVEEIENKEKKHLNREDCRNIFRAALECICLKRNPTYIKPQKINDEAIGFNLDNILNNHYKKEDFYTFLLSINFAHAYLRGIEVKQIIGDFEDFSKIKWATFLGNQEVIDSDHQDLITLSPRQSSQVKLIDPLWYSGHTGQITAIGLIQNSTIVFTAGADGLLRLWDSKSGKPLMIPEKSLHNGYITTAISIEDSIIVSAGKDDRKIHFSKLEISEDDIWTLKQLYSMHLPTEAIWSLNYNAEHKLLAMGTQKGGIKVYEIQSDLSNNNTLELMNLEIPKCTTEQGLSSICFSRDGQYLFAASYSNSFFIWKLINDGTNNKKFILHDMFREINKIHCMINHPYSSLDIIYLLSVEGEIKRLDCNNYTIHRKKRNISDDEPSTQTTPVYYPPEEIYYKTIEYVPTALRSAVIAQDCLFASAANGHIYKVPLTKEGELLETRQSLEIDSQNTEVKQNALKTIKDDNRSIRVLCADHEGARLLAAGLSQRVLVFDIHSGKEYDYIRDMQLGGQVCIDLHPSGEYLATGNTDSSIRIWNIKKNEDPKLVRIHNDHSGRVSSLAFSRSGRFLISGGDQSICVWPIKQPKTQWYSKLFKSKIWNQNEKSDFNRKDIHRKKMEHSDDESILPEHILHRFTGHEGFVRNVKWLNNEKYIVSTDSQGYLYLWDFFEGNQVQVHPDPNKTEINKNQYISALHTIDTAFSSYVLVGYSNATIQLFKLSHRSSKLKSIKHCEIASNGQEKKPIPTSMTIIPHRHKIHFTVMIGDSLGNIYQWHPKRKTNGKALKPILLKAHESKVRDLKYCYNRKLLFSSSSDRSLKIWRYKSKSLEPYTSDDNKNRHYRSIRSIAVCTHKHSKTSINMYSACIDGSIKAWKIPTKDQEKYFQHLWTGYSDGLIYGVHKEIENFIWHKNDKVTHNDSEDEQNMISVTAEVLQLKWIDDEHAFTVRDENGLILPHNKALYRWLWCITETQETFPAYMFDDWWKKQGENTMPSDGEHKAFWLDEHPQLNDKAENKAYYKTLKIAKCSNK